MHKKWKANSLPVVGCPECVGEGKIFIHEKGEELTCSFCNGNGVLPKNFNRVRCTNSINNELKYKVDGYRN